MIEKLVEVLKAIYNLTLGPILSELLYSIFLYLSEQLWKLVNRFFFLIFKFLLILVDAVESIYSVFAGLQDVRVIENGKTQSMRLLDYLMGSNVVTNVFIYITIFAAMLGFLFAAFATARSIADSAMGEEKYPLSKVLRSGLKCALGFAWVPFFCLLVQKLASTVITGVLAGMNAALDASGSSTIAELMFLSVSQDAFLSDDKREAFYQMASGTRQFYRDMSVVETYMDITKIHYFYGYLLVVPIVLILFVTCLQFIRRIFDLMLLYVVSPFFTSTIVLDDGVRFRKWRELFIGKYFASYAIVVIMRMFLFLVPMLSNKTLIFSRDETLNLVTFIVFVIGAGWSCYKAQETLIKLIAPGSVAQDIMADNQFMIDRVKDAKNMAQAAATGGTSAAAGAGAGIAQNAAKSGMEESTGEGGKN